MSAIRKNIWSCLAIFSFILSGWTQPFPERPRPAAEADQVAVLLLLDNSGSMETSDPGNLRFTGIRLFASLLDPGDSLGLILFSTRANLLTDGLIALQSQTDKENFLSGLSIQKADGYTDMKAALEQAQDVLEQADLQDRKVVIVLLTDGKPEIENPYPAYERETMELAASLNTPFMAIALTEAAQTPFLDQLAAATGGTVISAEDASDLLNAYLQTLGQIKGRTVMRGDALGATSSLEIDPALAPYIPSVSFVIGKSEADNVRLFGPDGREITERSPHVSFADSRDPRYFILTMENPTGGTYSFRAQEGKPVQSWMILRSHLRVNLLGQKPVHPLGRELPIVVELLEEASDGKFTKIIGEGNFSAQITRPDGSAVGLDQFYDDGSHGDALAGDGNYTRQYPNADMVGEYLISVRGWKGTIPLQAEGRVRVVQFPSLVLDSPLKEVSVRDGKVELRVHLEGGDPPTFDEGEVVARVLSPSGRVNEIVLQENGAYSGEFLPAEDGEYQVTFETRRVKYRGVDYLTSLAGSFRVTIVPFAEALVEKVNIPSACFSQTDEVGLSLAITSSREEMLRLSVPDDWQVTPEVVKVKQGEQSITVRVTALNGLGDRLQSVDLLIEGEKNLEVRPDASLRVEVQSPSVWTRCRAPIRLGGGLLIVLMIAAIALNRSRTAALPLPVTGTLRHWPIDGNPTQAVDVDLTALRMPHILIGSGAACNVLLTEAGLDLEHARMFTQKTPDGVEIYLEPIGETRKGYALQSARFILRHGEVFKMGAHAFQYLSDHGE